jgi:nucleotide-binding universal stress UspA family protein
MFKNILVPLDGSKFSQKAAVAAIDLASRYGSKVHFLTVTRAPNAKVSEGLRRYMEVEHILGRPEDLVESMAQEVLGKAERHARKKGVKSLKSTAETGQPAKVILDVAKRTNADLIVVGSRGLGELPGMLLGSVSLKVSSLAPCPCLIAR